MYEVNCACINDWGWVETQTGPRLCGVPSIVGMGNEFGTWWIGIVTITPLLSLRGMSHAGGYGGAYMIEN